ncbi:alpha/beta hydrolase [Mycolicibacterium sp.]|uniref:alpha/beta hydrolase n=1 Tax=Mycolicibacterium sp. TaxID=2320850 RepID=UPI001A2F591A|nr:alpha/beta hydrolase [Mycolicibacterium sp.]MBJ7399941.1 alpha/beta hydrolase [Mycolicibacterium sp.]
MRRAGRIGSALFVCAVVASGVIAGPAEATPGADQTTAAKPVWGSCDRFITDAFLPTAECTDVPVPIDEADPAGAQAQLAVIRIPATGKRLGSLLMNPGGPGASAVDLVVSLSDVLSDSPITEHFDLVGFDPRGVGYSTPELRCRTDAEFDAWRREPMVDYSKAGVAVIEGFNRTLAQQCLDQMGKPFLAGVGTASAAKDMDAVRQALGEDQINYLGFSYGTELGTAYVQRFPNRVRTMVLDGAIDPNQNVINSLVDQMAGFQLAFTDYAADCAKSSDCPLGTDPAQFVNRYLQLVDPLVAKPAATSDPRGLSYADAHIGTINALYTPRYWKYLTRGLLALKRGTNADALLLLADDYQRRDDDGHYSNSQDAFNAIRCVDSPTPSDPALWADADRRIRERAPFLSYGEFTGFGPRDLCAFWPVPTTSAPHVASPAPPGSVVVVSTTHDPATPYQAGVDLARQLNAPLITYEGTQHTAVFGGDACVDDTIIGYLVDRVVPGDIRC